MKHGNASLAVALALAAGGAAAGPHEHGVGHLQAAVDGRTLAIEVRLPAKDLVGFERAPRTDAERARIEDARRALADPRLFQPAAAAKCTIVGAPSASAPAFSGKTGAADDHADFEATHRFECADSGALSALEHGVFKAFPRIKQLRVQAVGPKGQKQATLTHGKPRLSF
jgi:hypothetical protein